jgi:hypothetical protein
MFGMTRLTPWGLVHHVPEFLNRKKRNKKDTEATAGFSPSTDDVAAETPKVAKKRSFSLVPWFFSSKSIENNTFTSHDRNESFMRKMVAKNTKAANDNQMPMEILNKTETETSERGLLNAIDTKGTSNGSDDAGDAFITDERQYANIGSPLPQSYQSSSSPPILPPHYATPFNGPTDLNTLSAMLAREQARSTNLESRSMELSNRVEELEVILSEYFINTVYLDQLRSRKKAKLIPASDKDSVETLD